MAKVEAQKDGKDLVRASCVTLGARGLLASDSALTEGEVHAHYGHGMAETSVKRKYPLLT